LKLELVACFNEKGWPFWYAKEWLFWMKKGGWLNENIQLHIRINKTTESHTKIPLIRISPVPLSRVKKATCALILKCKRPANTP